MFSRELNYFKNAINPFNKNDERSPQRKTFTELMLLMASKSRYWGDDVTLLDKLDKVVFKNELELSLKEKAPVKKTNKV